MDQVAIYIHIPFCRTRCPYCDFNTYAGLGAYQDAYVAALVEDIASFASGHSGQVEGETLYLGGGTPSLLSAPQVGQLIGACQSYLKLGPKAEATLEANPATVNEGYLRELRRLGVNRLSLGAQSFNPKGLRILGRDHAPAAVVGSYRAARRAGFDNVNLDLIYGWPGQTLHAWAADLRAAVSLDPEHLSLYPLTLEEDTPLGRQAAAGHIQLPSEDLVAEMYERAEEVLEEAGYRHYEISNWARPPTKAGQGKARALACQHNLFYWRNRPYLGFGAGAHSYYGGLRYYQVRDPRDYIRRLQAGQNAVEGCYSVSRADEIIDTLLLGLRLDEGIAFADFAARFGQDLRHLYRPEIGELCQLNLLEQDEAGIRLTRRGRLLANEALVRFLRRPSDPAP